MELWNKENDKNNDDRYIINRKITSNNHAKNIYVDEDYLYSLGGKNIHVFYERGISRDFVQDDFSISKAFVDKDMLGAQKLIINGEDYLVTINLSHISLYKVRLSSPEISCPVLNIQNQNEVDLGPIYGDFEFQ